MRNNKQDGLDAMRGFIHTHGIESAARIATAALPIELDNAEWLQGAILAAYNAGQLAGLTNA